MYGWAGKILEIDLSTGDSKTISPDISLYKKYIGGKGLAGYFLKPFIHHDWDSSEMPLLLFNGPLVNTASPTSGRMTIMSRSPLTGTVGDTSVGGKLGTQIKKAGFDGIIIKGISSSLCGIVIHNNTIDIVNASRFSMIETDKMFQQLNYAGSTAVIGPAAEKGVLFSNIAIDGHFFSGRNGLGLIMANKNIKFISVSGDSKTEVFDNEGLMNAREQIFRLVSASPILKGELGISEYGTGALYDLINARRMMPTKNFRETWFPDGNNMNASQYKKKYETKKSGCAGCNILCKQRGKKGDNIPEFETMAHFSALIDNIDIETVVEANRLCNVLGMDTISAASTIACYSEIQNIKISKDDLIRLLKNIAFSVDEGEDLKKGARIYSEKNNHKQSSITVKGLELPAYDPRGAYGMALAYATSTRGGCHLRAYPISHEILRKPVATDRFSFSGKARIVKLGEDINAAIDSITACKFVFFAASLEEYSKAFTAVTNVEMSAQDLLKTGERIYYNERIMNAINGFNSHDDDLPERFFKDEGSSGEGIRVKAINRSDFLTARSNYYKIRGLDKNGMPTLEKSKELGLEWRG